MVKYNQWSVLAPPFPLKLPSPWWLLTLWLFFSWSLTEANIDSRKWKGNKDRGCTEWTTNNGQWTRNRGCTFFQSFFSKTFEQILPQKKGQIPITLNAVTIAWKGLILWFIEPFNVWTFYSTRWFRSFLLPAAIKRCSLFSDVPGQLLSSAAFHLFFSEASTIN